MGVIEQTINLLRASLVANSARYGSYDDSDEMVRTMEEALEILGGRLPDKEN